MTECAAGARVTWVEEGWTGVKIVWPEWDTVEADQKREIQRSRLLVREEGFQDEDLFLVAAPSPFLLHLLHLSPFLRFILFNPHAPTHFPVFT
jgi:hypothetical protein